MTTASVSTFRCLIVDDNQFQRELLHKVLTSLFQKYDIELQCDQAESGEEGIDYWSKGRYALTIMDFEMGGIRGDEAAEAILKKHPGAKIVGYTAAHEKVAQRCKEIGMQEVFPKDVVQVRDYVKQLITTRNRL